MKWLVLLVALAGAGAGYWYWFQPHGKPVEYLTAPVERGELTQAVTATGQIGPVVNVQVGSQISGIVRKIYVDYNSVVKSNEIIAEIDPLTYQMSVRRAEADLANAQANLTLSKVQADRADSLYTNNLISASDHDTATAQMRQAEAQVQSSEAALQNAKVQLSYCTIYAPVDGVVISRSVDVGQTVAASFNTPTLFVIANDLKKMQIDALVSEADIGGVRTNEPVDFNVDAFPYTTFHGEVSQIRYGAITNQNVVNYDCVISVNNSDLKLLPGMTANVSIITAQKHDALKIPNAALRWRPPETVAAENQTNTLAMSAGESPAAGRDAGGRGGRGGGRGGPSGGGRGGGRGGAGRGANGNGSPQMNRTVYVLPPSAGLAGAPAVKPQAVQVTVGISDGVTTEVLGGLKEGDQVVTGEMTTSDLAGARPSNPFGGFRRF